MFKLTQLLSNFPGLLILKKNFSVKSLPNRVCSKHLALTYILSTNSSIADAEINMKNILKELTIALGVRNRKIESFVIYQRNYYPVKDFARTVLFHVYLKSNKRFDFLSDKLFRINFLKSFPASKFDLEVKALSIVKIGIFPPKNEVDSFFVSASYNLYYDGLLVHISLAARLLDTNKYLLYAPTYIFDGKKFSFGKEESLAMLEENSKKKSD